MQLSWVIAESEVTLGSSFVYHFNPPPHLKMYLQIDTFHVLILNIFTDFQHTRVKRCKGMSGVTVW